MVKKIRFPLEMEEGIKVRSIEELKKNFNLEKVVKYYLDGKLKIWLEHREYSEELEQLKQLQYCQNRNEIPSKLCKVFEVERFEDIKISEIERRQNRLSILNSYSDSEKWEKKLEFIVFSQEELEKKLLIGKLCEDVDNKVNSHRKEVYLCGKIFTVSDKFKNISYVGVNNPIINIVSDTIFDTEINNIAFNNVKITSNTKINAKIKEIKSCLIDSKKVNLKNNSDITYCKTFLSDYPISVVVDEKGNVHVFGLTPHGQKYLPKFEAPIIDIDISLCYVVAVDKTGKVYQWGKMPYECQRVPSGLPKIKQVVAGSKIIIALDEFGKLHWWGGYDSDKIFIGSGTKYKAMPNITSEIVQVVCEFGVVMALDIKGKIYSWGSVGYEDKSISVHNIPSNLPFIKKIVLGGVISFALDEDGKIHSWGENKNGSMNIPKDLPFIVDISKINCSVFSALDENGRVHLWGDCSERDYELAKKLPKLKYLVDIGGIDEKGYMYNGFGQLFDGLKALLPNK